MNEEQKKINPFKSTDDDDGIYFKYASANSVIGEIEEKISSDYKETNDKIKEIIIEANLAFDKVGESIDSMKTNIIAALEENEKERKKMKVLIIIALVSSIILAGISI